jgi:hypothetical protein
MPAYDICYMEEDGALVCAFTVQFDSELRAKVLAHAMKPIECHRLEVWDGRQLIYSRPERELDAPHALAHSPADDARYLASPA